MGIIQAALFQVNGTAVKVYRKGEQDGVITDVASFDMDGRINCCRINWPDKLINCYKLLDKLV
jgi:hypothetical protein